MGRRLGIAHKPAPDMLLHICDELQSKPNETIIIGDTELDIECGKNAEALTCGVSYGYRTKEFLISLKPDFVIDDLKEVLSLI
jgi:phosphoglycolate phosphatase-like HAD superfamily hydrolase